ncbi:putative F-box protein-like [Capsicum annuum]|nr:putative F-box protein-like [Capsicum annuum]
MNVWSGFEESCESYQIFGFLVYYNYPYYNLICYNSVKFLTQGCDLVVDELGLSFYTTEKGLSEAFSQHGQVIEAKIVTDKVSERSKGFGFVTYASEDEAEKALQEMNGKPLNGRVIFVDYAKPKTDGGGMPIARGPPEPPVEQ